MKDNEIISTYKGRVVDQEFTPIDKTEFKVGLPEVIEDSEVDFEHEDTPIPKCIDALTAGKKTNRPGAPIGRRNKAVFKDQMKAHFEKTMTKDFVYVLRNVVDQAIDGCTTSQKMLLDRVVPVSKAVDLDSLKGAVPLININIGSLEDKTIEVVSD